MRVKVTLLALLSLMLSGNLDAKVVTWLTANESYVVTTIPNAVIYHCSISEEDEKDQNRCVSNYLLNKSKVIKKPTSYLVKGYANASKHLEYDSYVVESNGKLFYIPAKYIADNSNIDALNGNLVAKYAKMELSYNTVKSEFDSLKTYYLNECKKYQQHYLGIKTNILHKIDSAEKNAPIEYENLQKAEYDKWYNSLPSSAKNASSKISITEAHLGGSNSAGGHDYHFSYINRSNKTIKYLYWTGTFYNKVNDIVYCTIRDYSQFTGKDTGPVEPNEIGGGVWDCVIYNWSAYNIKLASVNIIYMDGSQFSIGASDIRRLLNEPNSKTFRDEYGSLFEYVDMSKRIYDNELKACEENLKIWGDRVKYLSSRNLNSSIVVRSDDEAYNQIFAKISYLYNKQNELARTLAKFQIQNLLY